MPIIVMRCVQCCAAMHGQPVAVPSQACSGKAAGMLSKCYSTTGEESHQDLQHSCKDCHASGQRHCKSPHNQAIAILELHLSAQALMQSQFSAQRASRSKQLAALNSAIGQWHANQQKDLEAKRWPLIITPCKLIHNGGCL